MSSHLTLLDFDGVIINNAFINQFIVHRSRKYVQHKFKLKSLEDAKKVNDYVYKTFGHSSLTSSKDNTTSILEYNEYVFKNINYAMLSAYMTLQDKKNIHDMLTYKEDLFGLFSNAPLTWCENMCAIADVNMYDFIDSTYCFTSDVAMIKPMKPMYEYVDASIPSSIKKIKFVDDSRVNIQSVPRYMTRWELYHLDTSQYDSFHTFYTRNYSCFRH